MAGNIEGSLDRKQLPPQKGNVVIDGPPISGGKASECS